MSDYGIEEGTTIYNMVSESIYIYDITPKYITFTAYDDCGEVWRKDLRRWVYCNEKELYVKIEGTFIFTLKYH